MIVSVQTQFLGYRFRRVGKLGTHHDRVCSPWELGPEPDPPLVGGVDFGVVLGGELRSITGFLDFAPGVNESQT